MFIPSKNAFCGCLFLGAFATGLAQAQFTYPNCPNAVDGDFRIVHLVGKATDPGIEEPMKMDFYKDAEGNVDIYYVQRYGTLQYYSGKTKTVKTLGELPGVPTGNEDGLVGIALDPDFKAKNRVFLYYTFSGGFRLSRFDLDPATHMLKNASERILLTVKGSLGRWHTAGALRFDSYGDLWLGVGDNETIRKGPANTADFRGGLLRIHPEENGSYTIPAGNMWEFASKYFADKGKPAIAAKYLDTAQMKREIFVKGARNPYTVTVDPVRHWATWGDCGPDYVNGAGPKDSALWTEEHNVATEPSFRGWPYFTAVGHVEDKLPAGYDEPGESTPDWSALTHAMDPKNPTNTLAAAAGVDELLPAIPGTHSYAHSCAMTGPIYRYDGALNSDIKLPPHFNRMWFVTDWNKGTIQAIRLTKDGLMEGAAVDVFKGSGTALTRPLDFQAGPDGALYYLSHSCGTWYTNDACTGIYRIEAVKKSCQDPTLLPEMPTAAAPSRALRNSIEFGLDRVTLHGDLGHTLEVMDVSGRTVYSLSGEGEHAYIFDRVLQGKRPGLYFVRVANAHGSLSSKFAYFPAR
jgi:cytochrome c